MRADILVRLSDGVTIEGCSADGKEFINSCDENWAEMDPEIFIARVPKHLVIAIIDPRDNETFILRRALH